MKYFIFLLVLLNALVWIAVFALPDNNLHVVGCDVGQGDAILLTHKTTQILIDGGPNNRVLECLSHHMPFWDKTIEVVILTHPQTDHFTGLINVFKNYKIKYFLGNQVDASSESYGVLKSLVGGSRATVINPTAGFKSRVGLIYLDIVAPPQSLAFDTSNQTTQLTNNKLGVFESKHDPNDFSIIGHFSFHEFDVLTTGDISSSDFMTPKVELLKVPHHGSKNGLTQQLLDMTQPQVAIISAGRNNRYGHPHKEVINMLDAQNVKILRTDVSGNVEIISDGKRWWVK